MFSAELTAGSWPLAAHGHLSPAGGIANGKSSASPLPLAQGQISGAKRSYVTRRMDLATVDRLVVGCAPKAGDLALCKVLEIGQYAHLELVTGRRARLFPGDQIVVAFGERYATDQFHTRLPRDLSPCSLAAAGGIASEVTARHAKMKRATRIEPLGLLADTSGAVLNLASGAISPRAGNAPSKRPTVILVLGSSMNAGKTTTAANIIRSLARSNLKIGAMKLTGTGSGGDCWLFRDAGAFSALDFTDAGMASTYNAPIQSIENAGRLLLAALSADAPDFIVCEIADGLMQQETSALIASNFLKEIADCVVFAASDPLSAAAGVHVLSSHGYLTAAVSGLVSASPLACEEASRATGLRILTQQDFEADDDAAATFLQSARADRAVI